MKNYPATVYRNPRGFASFISVLSIGVVLLLLLLSIYKASVQSQQTQAAVTLQIDYSQKEDAILRAIIPIAANRAMRCMQSGSDASAASRDPLSWQQIFQSAINEANAGTSISSTVLQQFGLASAQRANVGDSTLTSAKTFNALDTPSRFTTPGINVNRGAGFPVPLQTNLFAITSKDDAWPIISTSKTYGSLAEGKVGAPTTTYPNFNLIPYPNIRFGYAAPGQMFVAKRNWWAFAMDLSDEWENQTKAVKDDREFILSIYEIPSQLAISAEAFTVLGEYADGTDWQNATVSGPVFATRADLRDGAKVDRLAGRRGINFAQGSKVGTQDVSSNPFTPGVREQYEIQNGKFMPVSLTSEAGRAAFIPINRGVGFFDRHAHSAEATTISPTTWNNYTVGAMQCRMHLDISDVAKQDDPTPTKLKFHYQKAGVKQVMTIDLVSGPGPGLPPGYIYCANENQTVVFDYPVDVAYGKNGSYYYQNGVSGSVTFNNARFGDPLYGTFKAGYYRPSYPFQLTTLNDSKICIEIYPQRFQAFLGLLKADPLSVNNSLSVNVDYPANSWLKRPSIPCTDLDYGVILKECANLTNFPKGFSMVTNLRLYVADDFNVVSTAPPVGSGLSAPFFPPCSLFAPEKRYGANYDPFSLKISGQLGSLAGDTGSGGSAVNLLDLKSGSETAVAHKNIEVNLSPIVHPAALPPITMMNWLVVIEERRREYYTGS